MNGILRAWMSKVARCLSSILFPFPMDLRGHVLKGHARRWKEPGSLSHHVKEMPDQEFA